MKNISRLVFSLLFIFIIIQKNIYIVSNINDIYVFHIYCLYFILFKCHFKSRPYRLASQFIYCSDACKTWTKHSKPNQCFIRQKHKKYGNPPCRINVPKCFPWYYDDVFLSHRRDNVRIKAKNRIATLIISISDPFIFTRLLNSVAKWINTAGDWNLDLIYGKEPDKTWN